MPAGKLDQRITIERVTRSPDGVGGFTEAWAAIDTVWASVRAVGGSETWQTMRETGAAQFQAIIRWQGDDNGQPKYTNLDRVLWRGRTYGISVVLPYGKDRQHWLQIALTEGEAS